MFTGIVEDVGRVSRIQRKDKESVFTFEVRKIDMDEVVLGESIAVNGACLTVTSIGKRSFTVDASHETLDKTNLGELQKGSSVNLERCLRADGKLGGHIVNGHVDGVGKVKSIKQVGDSHIFRFSVPKALAKYIVEKGSVAVSGVSLTINQVKGKDFTVNIIPYTLQETIFGEFEKGSSVNIECDIIGKYVEKFAALSKK